MAQMAIAEIILELDEARQQISRVLTEGEIHLGPLAKIELRHTMSTLNSLSADLMLEIREDS
jgi:hypothetical protein